MHECVANCDNKDVDFYVIKHELLRREGKQEKDTLVKTEDYGFFFYFSDQQRRF